MFDAYLVGRTEEFLKHKLDDGGFLSEHPEAKAYRLEHSYRVANIGRRIAIAEGFDETRMVIACLLHDVSYCEDFGEDGWKEHGRRAAQIARPFLEELGLPKESIEEICYGIAIHVDDEADFEGERTPFALTIGDADNIDRFDAYRIHETLVKAGFIEMSFDQKKEYVDSRIKRLKEFMDMPMGTKSAADLWKERLSFYVGYYEKLSDQLKNSKSIV